MIHAGAILARRLEAAEAANDADCVAEYPRAVMRAFGGGVAIFAGADSPLTRAIGLGLAGHVADTEVDALEDFFLGRGARPTLDFCPLADTDLLESLQRRGYRPVEFNNVLVRSIAGAEPYPPDARIHPAGDADLWAYTVGRGFFESPHLSGAEMDVGRAVFQMGRAECYLAMGAAGEYGSGAALSVRDGLALLFADGTIPQYRRQGMHAGLIRARLNSALAQECELAAATTLPGSASQRNFERHGFQVVYTKVVLSR